MIYTANNVSPLEKTMHFLHSKFNIDYMTYARYSDDCIEWMTSNRKRLDRFLSDKNSLYPIDVVDQTSVVDMSRYCSKDFLNYCEFQCDHKQQGVTMVLKHNEHFHEHISLSSSDNKLDIKDMIIQNAEMRHSILTYIRHGANLSGPKDKFITNRSRKLLAKSLQTPPGVLKGKRHGDVFMYGNLGGIYIRKPEFDCILLMLKLLTSKQIARELHVSFKTVESRIANLKRKLGIEHRHELYILAKKNHLV